MSGQHHPPLTQLCRDNCGYCTFARPPRPGQSAYLTENEVLEIARAGAAAGCHEALFTLGDRPERRYAVARHELATRGFDSTVGYLAHVAGRVMDETGLLPHVNAGVLSSEEIARLRRVSASGGLMLEQYSPRLLERGGAHWASPDKRAQPRIDTVASARDQDYPFTSGVLIGIGETLAERAASIAAVSEIADQRHIQELIVQNFQPKAGTAMAAHPPPSLDEFLRAIAVTRLATRPDVAIQAPPNLAPDGNLEALLAAGINDWGGVSPVTIDHVNPESPWPQLAVLEAATATAGLQLTARLCVYPAFARDFDDAARWLDPRVLRHVLAASDTEGLVRTATGGRQRGCRCRPLTR